MSEPEFPLVQYQNRAVILPDAIRHLRNANKVSPFKASMASFVIYAQILQELQERHFYNITNNIIMYLYDGKRKSMDREMAMGLVYGGVIHYTDTTTGKKIVLEPDNIEEQLRLLKKVVQEDKKASK